MIKGKSIRHIGAGISLIIGATFLVSVANAEITGKTAPPDAGELNLDYANAQAIPMPSFDGDAPLDSGAQQAPVYDGPAGFEPGNSGKGRVDIETLPEHTLPLLNGISSDDDFTSNEYGTSLHPYSTTRVDAHFNLWQSKKLPYRQTGKLYFKKPNGFTYVCSASLIKPGVLVTAAHCVAAFGQSQFYNSFEFHPAKFNAQVVQGTWQAAGWWVMSSYYNGTDSCYQSGVICQNDVAVIRLKPKYLNNGNPWWLGNRIGWYGYGYGGWGFVNVPFSSHTKNAQLTQLGYPQSHDSGLKMQRNDSLGYTYPLFSNNTLYASRMTGGSSGGPLLLNLGRTATLSGTSVGSYSANNVIVGVTSWGYTNTAVKLQGASPFTSGNIVPLLNAACAGNPTSGNKYC